MQNGATEKRRIFVWSSNGLMRGPFYHTEIAGDFVMRVKVSHDFKDTYDSASIKVMQDKHNWANV